MALVPQLVQSNRLSNWFTGGSAIILNVWYVVCRLQREVEFNTSSKLVQK